jgi:hypothetical protein
VPRRINARSVPLALVDRIGSNRNACTRSGAAEHLAECARLWRARDNRLRPPRRLAAAREYEVRVRPAARGAVE